MPINGIRPSRDIMFILTKACKDAGRLDLAQAYAREFVANGVSLRPGLAAMLEIPDRSEAGPTASATAEQRA